MRAVISRLVPALFLALVALPAPAQWQGTGRAQGVVLDEKGEPLRGARVTLRLEAGAAEGGAAEGGLPQAREGPAPPESGAPQDGPPATVTDKRGRWAFLGLAGGRWRLTIEAEGYLPSNGWIQVPDEGPAPLTRVELRPLAEVSPLGVEGNPGTVRAWLEKGNALLDQGRWAEARAEYVKAVNALPPEEHPEVLRSIARTHYQEGDREGALEALKHALYDVPGDAATRELLGAVMAGMGRREEARAWLARLDAEGRDFIAAELGFSDEAAILTGEGGGREGPEALPLVPPEPHRPGRYRTSFAERSPLSGVQVFARRYGVELAEIAGVDPAAGRYDLAEESFEVFVPETYRPERPAGLFVWVSPTSFGGLTRQELLDVLAEKDLIWVGANLSGNDRPKWTRMGLALDAVHNLGRLYDLDPERIYVAGYSGGGRIASALALVYPEVFQGAFCFFGVDFYRRVSIPDKPGAHWPPAFPEPGRGEAREVKEEQRYVLLTGELDFNRVQTRAYHGELVRDGFRHVTYLEIPGASHYAGVEGDWFARGIDALDAPLGRSG